MRDKFLLATVKEWLKSVLNYRSYLKNKTGYPFCGPPCMCFYIFVGYVYNAVFCALTVCNALDINIQRPHMLLARCLFHDGYV